METVKLIRVSSSADALDTGWVLAPPWANCSLMVADHPGAFVNRCLMSYLVSALKLVEAGQKPEHVDGVLKRFGMPMGALELADRTGLDLCQHLGDQLSESQAGLRHAVFSMPGWFRAMVEDGLLGEKSGRGFYVYEKGRRVELNARLADYLPGIRTAGHESDADLGDAISVMSKAEIVDYCLIPMLLEALACCSEQVAGSPDELDAVCVYAIGFPSFRGGLLRYFASYGMEELKARVIALGYVMPENMDLLAAYR